MVEQFDEYAVETALRLTESSAGGARNGEVVVVSIGPKDVSQQLRSALAMGADRGILVDGKDEALDADVVARTIVKLVEKEQPDLVLMDVEMPVMNGLEATTAIRQRESWQGGHVPVVAVTSIPDVARCFAAGMDAHLPKPLQAEALHLTMQRFTPR